MAIQNCHSIINTEKCGSVVRMSNHSNCKLLQTLGVTFLQVRGGTEEEMLLEDCIMASVALSVMNPACF